ncbi:hypothetical protein M2271_007831 [Streptomyces sp. LBL]|nr:hypothetical protein [Streptomyces sp. LBL]
MWYKSAAWFVRTPWPTELAHCRGCIGPLARDRKVRDNLDG